MIPRCPECQSYKVTNHITYAFVGGGCLLIIPPIGFLMLIFAILWWVYAEIKGTHKYICRACHKQWTVSRSEKS